MQKSKTSFSLTAFSLIEISVVLLIISIVISGIYGASKILARAKIRSAQDLTKYSPVYNIDGLVLWLEPISESTFINSSNSTKIKNNESIKRWVDLNPQSLVKNNAWQDAVGNMPKYISKGVNGLPTVRFDGVDDYFRIPKVISQDWTIIFVYVYQGGGYSEEWFQGAMLLGADSPGQNHDFGVSVYSSGLNAAVGNMSSSTFVNNPNAAAIGKPYIGIYTRDSATGQLDLYVNGDSGTGLAAGAIGTGVKSSPAILSYFIGADPGLSWAYFFKGDIAEIIMFSKVLEKEDRKAVEHYLSKKWGIQLNK